MRNFSEFALNMPAKAGFQWHSLYRQARTAWAKQATDGLTLSSRRTMKQDNQYHLLLFQPLLQPNICTWAHSAGIQGVITIRPTASYCVLHHNDKID
jgi:hypothetical protein